MIFFVVVWWIMVCGKWRYWRFQISNHTSKLLKLVCKGEKFRQTDCISSLECHNLHCKNYSNVHFKSQNYSCVLDSHTCLGDRISCCRKISGDKSKIKAVILMEIIKTTESRSQIYTGIFLSLSLWQWKKITSTVFSV